MSSVYVNMELMASDSSALLVFCIQPIACKLMHGIGVEGRTCKCQPKNTRAHLFALVEHSSKFYRCLRTRQVSGLKVVGELYHLT